MTKLELEEALERSDKEVALYKAILYEIKSILDPAAETFNKGLAEDTPYNQGIKQALSVISDTINSRLSRVSYLRCPSFKNNLYSSFPTFTIINGGLSNNKEGIINKG